MSREFETLLWEADKAGREAARVHIPTPMVVSGYESTPVMGGVCGFAWVSVRPRTSPFARYLGSRPRFK